jgi:UDPglucose 6-dehydrogenase
VKRLKRISVVGLGFVGLSTAVYFADQGYNVIASSNQQRKVELIRNGVAPFFEPELETMLKNALKNRKLRVVVGRETAVLDTDITFITVGTPSLLDGSVNLTFVKAAAKEIGAALKRKQSYHLIVIKSTVPPGTSKNVVKPIVEKYSEKKAGEDFGLAMSPEFLREGSSMYDIANPDRVVIGEFNEQSGSILEELNRELYKNKVPILRMSLASAELAKYASNAFLATKISFINEMANVCERIPGVDVVEIAHAMGLDPRIGPEFLRAGAGWGGSCFPKDTKALVAISRKLGYESKLIEEAISINVMQAKRMIELAEEELGNLEGKKIAILGLSFKPNTDDIREAASLKIIELLLAKGAEVAAFDPVAMDNVKEASGDRISYSNSVYECLENADCCMLVTEWSEFKKLQPSDFTRLMRNPILIDGRRIYDPTMFSKKLKLRAIGLGQISEEKL